MISARRGGAPASARPPRRSRVPPPANERSRRGRAAPRRPARPSRARCPAASTLPPGNTRAPEAKSISRWRSTMNTSMPSGAIAQDHHGRCRSRGRRGLGPLVSSCAAIPLPALTGWATSPRDGHGTRTDVEFAAMGQSGLLPSWCRFHSNRRHSPRQPPAPRNARLADCAISQAYAAAARSLPACAGTCRQGHRAREIVLPPPRRDWLAELDRIARENGYPENWRLSDEEREATRAQVLARTGKDLWVFAYGSLMWDPGIHIVEIRIATLTGFHRRFCLKSRIGRGSADNPALMAALDSGGDCQGLALRIPGRARGAGDGHPVAARDAGRQLCADLRVGGDARRAASTKP